MSVDTSRVMPKSNGHLMCEECGTYWCLHVEQYVKDAKDADIIWSNYPEPVMIEVPIIPTSNLWATVVLEKPDKAQATMYRVGFFKDVASGETIFIGFIHPGESRSVMRSMLLEWFAGTQAPEAAACTSRGHGYTQTMRLNEDRKHPGKRVAQQWSMWATGKCLGCTFDSGSNPDLVPDGDPKNSASPW